jgi:hypothetical protein
MYCLPHHQIAYVAVYLMTIDSTIESGLGVPLVATSDFISIKFLHGALLNQGHDPLPRIIS